MFTKLIDRNDWVNQPTKDLISEAYELSVLRHPAGNSTPLDSKLWENALAVSTLNTLPPEANILGVGAGLEVTSFMLANRGYNVFPTDIYLAADQWQEPALVAFALNPELVFPNFSRRRIYPINADARYLPFPDGYFDGVYSSGSLEHFGTIEDITQAVREMVRVVKPGGKISISTEFRLSGPENMVTWDPTVYLFTLEKLREIFESIEEISVIGGWGNINSERVLSEEKPTLLLPFLMGEAEYKAGQKNIYPNLLMSHEGFQFCSVHIEIEKLALKFGRIEDSYRKIVNDADIIRFSNLFQFKNPETPQSELDNNRPVYQRLRVRLLSELDELVNAAEFYGKNARKWNRRIVAYLANKFFRLIRRIYIRILGKI